MDTINININIPAPPEGWGEVEYRSIQNQDDLLWTGCRWINAPKGKMLFYNYPVARKLPPPWAPPQELETSLLNIFGEGWLLLVPSCKAIHFSKQKYLQLGFVNQMVKDHTL